MGLGKRSTTTSSSKSITSSALLSNSRALYRNFALVDRLARLNALGRYVERQMGAQTTPTETAWIQESEQSLRRQAGKELDEDFVPGANPPRARARQFA